MKTYRKEFNGYISDADSVLNACNEFQPEITHLPGDWSFRTEEERQRWIKKECIIIVQMMISTYKIVEYE